LALKLAWVITGAGHLLRETFETVKKLKEDGEVKVTSFLSPAAEQVVKMYGLWEKLEQISPGGHLEEIFTEEPDDPGFVHAGRFIFGTYDMVLVSPASGNTVAKLVSGIADTLPTTVVTMAQKADVSVYVVPTDRQEGYVTTILPTRIDRKKCKKCVPCAAAETCPHEAITVLDLTPRIAPGLCQGCGVCVAACPFEAVKQGERRKLRIRRVDAENVKKLEQMENIVILDEPHQLEQIAQKQNGDAATR